jgi:DNA-binding GntR family transcriptional regulator
MAYVRKKEGSKQETAYQTIKTAILENKIDPDKMLVESSLCEMLGFSKTPIREALKRLTAEGFVTSIPEKGTFVTKLTIDEMIQLYDVREVLEGLAARLCALRSDKKLIHSLGKLMHRLEEDLQKKNNIDFKSSHDYNKTDMQFHDVVIHGCHNDKLISFSKTMIAQIYRFALRADHDRQKLSFFEHKKVYEAISQGDSDGAERLMREHIKSVKAYQIKKYLPMLD